MQVRINRFVRAFTFGAATVALVTCSPQSQQAGEENSTAKETASHVLPAADSSGYAEAAEGLKVYYEVRGKGEPIVVLAGGLMDINSMAQVIGPLSKNRQVVGIDLEGHGKTGLRDTPMTHERLGDDVAAVLRHLKIPQADVAGYSHGGAAALRTAIQHPDMVRNLILISTPYERDGWYPSTLQGMGAVSSKMAEQMKGAPIFKNYGHPKQLALFLDRMGELLRKDYDWEAEARALPMPVLLVYADHDSVSMDHIGDFFALFGGGDQDPGFPTTKYARARLAIIPGYSHYNFGQGPDLAEVIDGYLKEPTSKATQFAPG